MSPDTEIKTRLFTPWLVVPDSYDGPTMDDGRPKMQITYADADRFHAAGRDEWIEITDHVTGAQWLARQSECGAGCRCAAEAKPVGDAAMGSARTRQRKSKEPAQRWRTLPSHGRSVFGDSEEEIVGKARVQADELGTAVAYELWSEDHPQDYLNEGWACLGTVRPSSSGQR